MLLKISKMTPRCPKRLLGDEYTGESRLPSSEYTGESITNSNNSSNIRKNSKSFLGVSNGTRRRCLMKKTRGKKSRDTIPLNPGNLQHKCEHIIEGALDIISNINSIEPMNINSSMHFRKPKSINSKHKMKEAFKGTV